MTRATLLSFQDTLRRLPDSLDVLRRRDFRLLFLGQTVSVLGDQMVVVALAFAVLDVGGSASEVGLVLAAAMVPMVGSVLVGGVVGDRASRRAVMVGADVVRVASQGTMAALLVAGAADVLTLALLAGVTGVATGFFNPASTGLLPEVVPPELLQPANALRASGLSTGKILGPIVAGVLVAVAGPGWAIAADAGTFAVSAACLMMLRLPRQVAPHGGSFLADLRDGWDAFRSRTWIWTFVVYLTVANMLWGAWNVLGPIVAARELGGAAAWGTVLAAVGVGALTGSVVATQVRPRRPLVFVALTEGLFALPLAFLALAPPLLILACGGLLSGAGMMLGLSVWESTLQRHVPADSLSRVSSYVWFGAFAFYPLGLVIWGPIAAAVGIRTALWLAFGLFAVALLALLAVPETRRLTTDAADDAVVQQQLG